MYISLCPVTLAHSEDQGINGKIMTLSIRMLWFGLDWTSVGHQSNGIMYFANVIIFVSLSSKLFIYNYLFQMVTVFLMLILLKKLACAIRN
jgi:hypothetical protein